MKFSKKHYENVSAILRNRIKIATVRFEQGLQSRESIAELRNLSHDFAKAFKEDNSRFDYTKFISEVEK